MKADGLYFGCAGVCVHLCGLRTGGLGVAVGAEEAMSRVPSKHSVL